jgi:1,4-alpha-glucan branching enzyme
MYEKFGAIVKNQRVEFQLFLPDATQYIRGGDPRIEKIQVIGDFQSKIGGKNWEIASAPVMTRQSHPKGWLYTYAMDRDLPDGFYQYKYYVTFQNQTTRWVTDPCTKYGGCDHENSAFVVDDQHTMVNAIQTRLPLKDLIIYELMIDDFTAEFRGDRAPIDAVWDKLDHLQTLGVNAVEFMPWTAWSGEGFSWGYDPFQFFSVEYRYIQDATDPRDKLAKLKRLINELHRCGIQVIMDGVFNHVTSRFAYLQLYQNPSDSPYIGSFEGGGFFEELDYRNVCTQEFILDVCTYWLDVFQIDGIRFDYTLGFYREHDPHIGITQLITEIKEYLIRSHKKNVALILEHLTDNRYEAINDTNQVGASGCWFDPFMYKSADYARNGNLDHDVLRILDANRDFATGKGPVTYIENHDHSTIVHQAGGRDKWFKTQPAAIALLTSPGAVMIHNGQEFGDDYWLPGSGDRRVRPRALHWQDYRHDFIGGRLFFIYQKLIALRKVHPALHSPHFFPARNHPDGYGAFLDKDVVVYHRYGSSERFIIIINYSDFDQRVDIPFSANGMWQDLLNDNTVHVNHYRLYYQRINSNWGRIYYQKG